MFKGVIDKVRTGGQWASGIVGGAIGSGAHTFAAVLVYPTPMYALAWMVACFFAFRSQETTAAIITAVAGLILQAGLYFSKSSIASIINYANSGEYSNFVIRLSIVICVLLVRGYDIFTDVHIYDLVVGVITLACAWFLPAPLNAVVEKTWNTLSQDIRKIIVAAVSCGVIYRCCFLPLVCCIIYNHLSCVQCVRRAGHTSVRMYCWDHQMEKAAPEMVRVSA